MPVEIKMVVFGESNSEVEIGVYELDLDARVPGSAVGWHLKHGQFAIVEGELLDGLCLHLDSIPDCDELICRCELDTSRLLAVMEDGDSNRAKPSVVPVGVVRDKEGIHLELLVADQVEGGVVDTLECVAEKVASREPDGKVWVRAHAHLRTVVCNRVIQQSTNNSKLKSKS